MQKLFKNKENTINRHIKEIYKSGELDENEELIENLDMAIFVGYKVNSIKVIQFRKFATQILHEYIQKDHILSNVRFK